MQTHPLGATSKTIALSVAVVLYAVLLLGQRQIVSRLKAKLTYPRTGYVLDPIDRMAEREPGTILSENRLDAEQRLRLESARNESKWRALLTVVLIFAMVILPSRYINSRWSVLTGGLLMAAALGVGTRKEMRLPWPALCAFPLVGLYFTVYPVGDATVVDQFVYLWFGAGLILILLGLVMVVRYLIAHSAAKSENG
jgi:hypothetical protein